RPHGKIAPAGEAMQHGREGALPVFLLQNARHVGVALAGMDHQRQPARARRCNVRAQALFLRVARAVVIMVIEPGLADRHHLGMARALQEIVRADVEFFVRVLRMRPDRAIDFRETVRDRHQLVMAMDPRGNRDDAADARGLCARNDRVEFAGKIWKIEMAMAVDEHGVTPFPARHNAETPAWAPATSCRGRCDDRRLGARNRARCPARPGYRAALPPTQARTAAPESPPAGSLPLSHTALSSALPGRSWPAPTALRRRNSGWHPPPPPIRR